MKKDTKSSTMRRLIVIANILEAIAWVRNLMNIAWAKHTQSRHKDRQNCVGWVNCKSGLIFYLIICVGSTDEKIVS